MTASNALIKSRYRVQEHGEVFTPPFIVARMLDLVDAKVKNHQARFLEPACGDGNFLCAILERRLQEIYRQFYYRRNRNQPAFEIQAFFSVSSLYGIELLADNVLHCRRNLLNVFRFYYEDKCRHFWTADKYTHNNQFFDSIRYVISQNIVQGNALAFCQTKGLGEVKKDKSDNPLPIVFSEWNSSYQQNKIIRKEWVYHDLVNNNQQQSFRQPETLSVSENQQNDLLTENNQQGDLFADLFAETEFRQPETVINGGFKTQPTKILVGKDTHPTSTPFSQTREFPPVYYWEISEEIYQKPRRHRHKGVKNA